MPTVTKSAKTDPAKPHPEAMPNIRLTKRFPPTTAHFHPNFQINPFFVISPASYDPNRNDVWSGFSPSPTSITFTFSTPVDRATFIPGTNFVVRGRGNNNIKGTSPDWSLDSRAVTFTSDDERGNWNVPDPDLGFVVILYGTDVVSRPNRVGRTGIRDIYGNHLDGNYGGSLAGSIYEGYFFFIG